MGWENPLSHPIPYPIPFAKIPSHLPKSHPNPKSQSHPNPKSHIPSHILNNLIGHLSRDVTQISKKGNFASRKNWKFWFHKYSKKGNFYADHIILASIASITRILAKLRSRTDLRSLYFNSGRNYKL